MNKRLFLAAFFMSTSYPVLADSDTLTQFFQKSKIYGQVRSYYFSRLYGATHVPNQSSFAIGGLLNIKSAPFLDGFGVGVSFYTANDLGTHGYSPSTVDTTMMGLTPSLNALGQAYVQYAKPGKVLVRAGDQIISTPWMNNSDARILPATYQALFAQYSPLPDVKLEALREFRWKSRTSPNYYKDNLYYATGYSGDPVYGGVPKLPNSDPQAQGTLAFGASTTALGAKAQAWYYDFYHFAKMFYSSGSYTLRTATGIDPLVGVQFVREWENNSLLNSSLGAQGVDNIIGNTVNSSAWGIQVGANFDIAPSIFGKGQLTWSYNEIVPHIGAIGGGAIVSPYTIGYATDPLYTTSMIRGLVEMGPGNGWKVKWIQNILHKQFLLMTAFARYHTYYNGNSNDAYMDLTYFPGGMLKGLSVRDRMEVANGGLVHDAPLNPHNKTFVYNRVMLTYMF